MADQLDGDLLELKDLGFSLKEWEGQWLICDLQDGTRGSIASREGLRQWMVDYRASVLSEVEEISEYGKGYQAGYEAAMDKVRRALGG